jgi:hypothetical protein
MGTGLEKTYPPKTEKQVRCHPQRSNWNSGDTKLSSRTCHIAYFAPDTDLKKGHFV